MHFEKMSYIIFFTQNINIVIMCALNNIHIFNIITIINDTVSITLIILLFTIYKIDIKFYIFKSKKIR